MHLSSNIPIFRDVILELMQIMSSVLLPGTVTESLSTRSFMSCLLFEAQQLLLLCKNITNRKTVLFTGRSFGGTANVLNNIVERSLIRDISVDMKPAGDLYYLRDPESATVQSDPKVSCELLKGILLSFDVSERLSSFSSGLIIPEDDGIEQHHIVHRIRFGPKMCVTVNFESEAEMEAMFTYANAAESAKYQQVCHNDMLKYFRMTASIYSALKLQHICVLCQDTMLAPMLPLYHSAK